MVEEIIAELQPEAHASRPRRILVVDDDESQVVVLEMRLAQQGFEVYTATSGEQALCAAGTLRPDLILLDLRLPDVEGFELCCELADAPETCTIPIIVLSGMEGADIVRNSRLAGCRYYVRKPYDPNVLLALIETTLGEL